MVLGGAVFGALPYRKKHYGVQRYRVTWYVCRVCAMSGGKDRCRLCSGGRYTPPQRPPEQGAARKVGIFLAVSIAPAPLRSPPLGTCSTPDCKPPLKTQGDPASQNHWRVYPAPLKTQDDPASQNHWRVYKPPVRSKRRMTRAAVVPGCIVAVHVLQRLIS